MKKYYLLIIVALILGLVLTGCSLLSNISQVPATEQSGVTYLTKALPLTGLVGLWRFDEGSGITAYDNSGTIPPNNGTVNGATYEPSPMGQALSFDGDDYVQLPASNTILNTDTFTIEAWFKTSVNHPAEGAEGRLITLYKGAAASTALSLYVEEDNIGFLYYNGTAHVWKKYPVNYYGNAWHHIAVTYDATTYKLYYNGEEVESWNDDFGWFGTCPASLGSYIFSERFFSGEIDEVRIWNRALDASELIRYGFKGLLEPYEPPPKAFKAGRSIPLKWQYTDNFGNEVESSAAEPLVKIIFKSTIDPPEDVPILVEDPGESGYHYHSDKKTWQFNWQTKECEAGRYEIWITSMQTGQINGYILIDLK